MGLFKSTISSISRGLARTRQSLTGGLRSLISGRTLDDALIDEVEHYLLTADVGVKTTTEIIAQLRTAARQ